jgi:hypothetical protein
MTAACPGMNPANWKFEDISDAPCVSCGAAIGFWKDDVRRIRSCGAANPDPRLGDPCPAWYGQAEERLGNRDIRDWKEAAR